MTTEIRVEMKKLRSEMTDLQRSLERLQALTVLHLLQLYGKIEGRISAARIDALTQQFDIDPQRLHQMLAESGGAGSGLAALIEKIQRIGNKSASST